LYSAKDQSVLHNTVDKLAAAPQAKQMNSTIVAGSVGMFSVFMVAAIGVAMHKRVARRSTRQFNALQMEEGMLSSSSDSEELLA